MPQETMTKRKKKKEKLKKKNKSKLADKSPQGATQVEMVSLTLSLSWAGQFEHKNHQEQKGTKIKKKILVDFRGRSNYYTVALNGTKAETPSEIQAKRD